MPGTKRALAGEPFAEYLSLFCYSSSAPEFFTITAQRSTSDLM
jgi:hypothetical protein